MTPGLDAGPCLAQQKLLIDPDETAEELEVRLAEDGAQLVLQTIADLDAGTYVAVDQDLSQVSKAPRLKKSDGMIDWRRSATQIKNQVRAMQPWHKAFTYWRREGSDVRLILLQVAVLGPPYEVESYREANDTSPGVVTRAGQRLLVAAREGILEILEVQPAGKRRMPVAEFLRGAAESRRVNVLSSDLTWSELSVCSFSFDPETGNSPALRQPKTLRRPVIRDEVVRRRE